ncbi:MAG TPA: TonB-dependent receptor [Hyphomicrobiales bacterium]|nr:TonB-dependent receptor [Hyphomicrobiales bacterium]
MRNQRLALAIVAGLPLAGAFTPVQAASDIEEITITSTRLEETIPLDLSRYGNQVEVITAEDITKRGFIDVTQTLQMLVPGLHIRPKNGPFDYFDASLQGSRNQDILWLIDGVRITNRLYNGTSPLDTVPAHMIERIEVLKGGQGIYYGTQSVGGVINIVTKSLQQQSDGAVSANVNTNNGQGLNGYYRGSTDRFQFAVYASKDEADGYQPYRNSDMQPSATDRDRSYDVALGGVKLGFAPTDNSLLSVHYQHSDVDLDFASPFLNYKTVNAREEDILTLKYDLQVNEQLGFFVKAYRHEWDTIYTRIRNVLDADGNVTGQLNVINAGDYWGYQDDGANAMLKFTSNHGLEYVAGYDLQKFSGYDEVWRIGDIEEKVNAYYLQLRTTEDLLPGTMLAFGARYNDPSHSESSTVWNFSGKHEFGDNLYVQTNIGTSFRLPDAEQLFLNEIYDDDHDGVPDDFFSVGNPNLKPEKSRNINVSIGGSIDNVGSAEITGFHRRITDYIYSYAPTEIAGVEGETFINTDDEVKLRGFEVNATVPLSETFSTNLSYTNTKAELNGGEQLVGIPESEVKLRLDFQPQAAYGLSLSLNHVGELNERQNTKRGHYTVMDLAGNLALGAEQEHNLALRIENLTDKTYATRVERGTRDAGGSYLYDSLGMERTLHASYTYRF